MSFRRNASILFILITLLLDTLGVGLLIPILPRLVGAFTGDDVSAASHYYGAFVAVYAAMQFVFAPILGALSDRFGRRLVILTSLLGATLDYLLLAFAPSLAWLFVGRVLAGITGASFSAASAYIADVSPPEKRAQSFGLMGAAFGIGFIVGPAVGGLLGSVHQRLPFLVAAGLNLLNFLYGLLVLPESLPPEHRRAFSLRRANPLASLRNLGRHALILGLVGTLVCNSMAQHILESVWALYTEQRFGWSALDVGVSLALVGLGNAIVLGGLVRVLVPRLGERLSLVAGLGVSAAGLMVYGLADRSWLMYALMLPFALGGIAGPAAQALISREVGPSEQGELQGSLASLQSLTAIIAPLVGTSLFAYFAPQTARLHLPGAPFFAAAGFNALALVLAVRLFARKRGDLVVDRPATGT
uniref:MFS transporter n=1 Tax=Sorangium cellulosum TaxID=56 RepID=V5UWV9_SORCE|nr:MFS transporter [Sorangium cellulosum]